jgi:hypothetical protein
MRLLRICKEEPAEPPRRLSGAEQDAAKRRLTGPVWWEDREALDARREVCRHGSRTFRPGRFLSRRLDE